jgi:hypothetical protein
MNKGVRIGKESNCRNNWEKKKKSHRFALRLCLP